MKLALDFAVNKHTYQSSEKKKMRQEFLTGPYFIIDTSSVLKEQ